MAVHFALITLNALGEKDRPSSAFNTHNLTRVGIKGATSKIC